MSSSIHNHPFVRALLGKDAAKVKAEAMRTTRAAVAAARHADRMLDETEDERIEAEAAEPVFGDLPRGRSMAALVEHAVYGAACYDGDDD